MGRTGIVVTGLVGLAFIVGAIIVFNDDNKKTTTNNTPANNQQPATNNQTNSPQEAKKVITYTGSAFSPSSLTVKSGDTVTIKNDSNETLQFESDPHPVHTDDPELNVGALQPGQSKTFTLTTKGTFGYHNHLDPPDAGSIIVE